ncbi:fluoride efflux transporter CrcB [Niallia sp. NCCP-28]|uniref:fluoride efflux transporter CrcB n=1 Tax=Niallia sp. NCCP-28 TaxID=2934712 RepID=UPI0020861231|nr:fluoride efflux transporter CrcB [Niallia sp. NCCP-28]GKU83932.1 chromosome condensation protein CrcB [Niallia sp. NCCP-28]
MSGLHILMVGIGGFFGSISRYFISKKFNNKYIFPIGTLTVNLLGAFLLGIIVGAKMKTSIILFFGTGFMGAFTTFSTLNLEMIKLHFNNYKKKLIYYITITYVGGVVIAYLGYIIGETIK